MKRDEIDDPVERREGDHLQYLLTAYLFDSLSPAGRGEVESHLSGCAACRQELEGLRATLGLLERTLGEDPAPYSFDERRRERVLAAARRPGGRGWLSIWRRRPLLSAAASLLMVGVLGGTALMPLFMCDSGRGAGGGLLVYQSAPGLAEYEVSGMESQPGTSDADMGLVVGGYESLMNADKADAGKLARAAPESQSLGAQAGGGVEPRVWSAPVSAGGGSAGANSDHSLAGRDASPEMKLEGRERPQPARPTARNGRSGPTDGVTTFMEDELLAKGIVDATAGVETDAQIAGQRPSNRVSSRPELARKVRSSENFGAAAPATPMALPPAEPAATAEEPADQRKLAGTTPARSAPKLPAPAAAATPAPAPAPGGAGPRSGAAGPGKPRSSETAGEKSEADGFAMGTTRSRSQGSNEYFSPETPGLLPGERSPEGPGGRSEQEQAAQRPRVPAGEAGGRLSYSVDFVNRPGGKNAPVPVPGEDGVAGDVDDRVPLGGEGQNSPGAAGMQVQDRFGKKLDAIAAQEESKKESLGKFKQPEDLVEHGRDMTEIDQGVKLREFDRKTSELFRQITNSTGEDSKLTLEGMLLHSGDLAGNVAEWGLFDDHEGKENSNLSGFSISGRFDSGGRGRGERGVRLGDAERELRAYWNYRALDPALELKTYFSNPLPVPPPEVGDEGLGEAEFRARYRVNPFVDTRIDHFSTFALDADTASFFRALDLLRSGRLPPEETVRVEEFVNSLPQEYAADPEEVFSVFSDGMPSIFGPGGTELLRIGIKARELHPGERRAAILTFAVDVSGSMAAIDVARRPGEAAQRLGLVKEALEVLTDALAPSDQVAVVGFAEQAHLVLPHTPARHAERIRGAIRSLAPRGGTNLEAGLDFAYRIAHEALSAGSLNRVILLSDGVSTAGARNPEEILEKARVFARRGIYLSVIGIGKGRYDDRMLERLANEANGKYDTIDSFERAVTVFRDNLPSTLEVLAEDAKLQVDFSPAAVSRYRLLGYENRDIRDQDFRNDAVDAGEVGPGTTVTALYEIVRHPSSAAPLGKVAIRYRDASTRLVVERDFPIPQGVLAPRVEDANASLRLLACAAELAELLRNSYYSRDGSFQNVILALRALEPEAPAARPGWPDLLEMAARAQVLTIRNLQALAAEPAPAAAPAGNAPAKPPAKQPANSR